MNKEAWRGHLQGLAQFSQRTTIAALSKESSVNKCCALVEKIERFADSDILRVLQTLPGAEDHAPQCAAGCDHCCHLWVRCSVPEALRVWVAVCSMPPSQIMYLKERVDSYATEFRAKPVADFPIITCPLLIDGVCSVYANRPLACRGTLSSARENPGSVVVPYLAPTLEVVWALKAGLGDGVMQSGLPFNDVVLGLALEVLFADAKAVDNYFAGQNVFEGAKAPDI